MGTTATTTRTTKRRGFTLIEMSLVMCVAGLLMVTTVPKAVALRRQMEIDTAAHRVARELKAAQHEAVRRNEPVTVTIVDNRAYTVGTRRIELPEGVRFQGSSTNVKTFPAFGPPVGGAGRYELRYTGNNTITRRAVSLSAGGMVRVE